MGSIQRDVNRHINKRRLPDHVALKIEQKYQQLWEQYQIRFGSIARSLVKNPSLYKQLDDLPMLRLFFRRPVEIALELAKPKEELWCRTNRRWVRLARYPERLLIDNPLSGRKECWSKLSSRSKSDYKVHHKSGGRRKKSTFLGNYEYIKPLEVAVFNRGRGLLVGEQEMRLYATFHSQIGDSAKKEPLYTVCLEVKREPRPPKRSDEGKPVKSGYQLSVHGYPIDRKGLDDDVAGTELNFSGIPEIDIPT